MFCSCPLLVFAQSKGPLLDPYYVATQSKKGPMGCAAKLVFQLLLHAGYDVQKVSVLSDLVSEVKTQKISNDSLKAQKEGTNNFSIEAMISAGAVKQCELMGVKQAQGKAYVTFQNFKLNGQYDYTQCSLFPNDFVNLELFIKSEGNVLVVNPELHTVSTLDGIEEQYPLKDYL